MIVWSQPLSVLRRRRILLKICLSLLLVVIITTALFVLVFKNAQAATTTVSFTARLKTATGSVVPDGFYNVGFKLYNTAENGTAIWSENYYDENGTSPGQDYRVRVVNGYLSVKLGSRTAFGSSVNWQDNLWLTMNIGGTEQNSNIDNIAWDGEMSPRIELTATPYAMSAGSVGGKTAGDLIHNSTDLQDASFNISGSGTAATLQATEGVTTPSIDRADAGRLTIGATNATDIYLAQDVAIASGKSLTLAGGSTDTRPVSPSEGTIYFDTTTKQLLVYANGRWKSESRSSTKVVAASNSSQSAKDGADFVADNEAVIGTSVIDGDQVQINAAIATLPPSGGSIYLTEGTYYLDGSIALPSNVTLSGAGSSTILTANNGFDTSLSLVTNSDPINGNRNITVRDITFHGNRDNIVFSNPITGITLTNVGSGSGTSANAGATISNSTFTHLRGNGVSIVGSRITSIHHNTFVNTAGTGVHLEQITNSTASDNSFNGVTMAIRMAEASYSFITNNSVEGSSSVNGALEMRDSATFNTITGNSFKNNTRTSIRLAGLSSGNLISNNLFADNGGTGGDSVIWVAGNSDENTISRNTFRDTVGTGHAINIDSVNANRTYLDGNSLGGPGASTINDAALDTIYAGQQTGTGNYFIRPGSSGVIGLVGDTVINGALTATNIQGSNFDSNSSGSLTIGGTNATGITIGNTSSSTTVQGELRTDSIDTGSATTLVIGGSNASDISLGQDTALALDKTLSVNGETTIKSGSFNSTEALKVQNTNGINQFTVDTANSRVSIGTPDTTGTLLVVDTKTSAGDPSGTNGAMYYNADASKFRCYEGGEWKDCITPLPISKVVEDDVENATDQAADVEDLQFNLAPNTKYYYKFMILHEATLETTGIGFGITTPDSPAMSNWCVNTTANLGSTANHWGSYCGVGDVSATTTGEAGIGHNFTSTMEGYIETGEASGDLTLRFKSQSNNTTTIKPGSFGILQIVQ